MFAFCFQIFSIKIVARVTLLQMRVEMVCGAWKEMGKESTI